MYNGKTPGLCAYKTTLTNSRSRFYRSIHRNILPSLINGFTNSRCRLLHQEPVPAVLSYITIFICPKSVPTFPPNLPEVQQIQGSQAKGNTLPWQIKSTLIILVFLPVKARFAAFCRTLRRALCRHILSKIIGRNGKSWQTPANRGRQT